MSKIYAFVANQFSGIYFDEENLNKAKDVNKNGETAAFDTEKDAYLFICNKLNDSLSKLYAVKNGRICGIFLTWEDCKNVTSGFNGAKFKGFLVLDDAVCYYKNKTSVSFPVKSSPKTSSNSDYPQTPFAFVDGSYNSHTHKYGYGVVLVANDKTYEFSGHNNDPQHLPMRNVAGEIDGAMRAIAEAINLNLPEITIFYDYEGIKKWATGEWSRNKKGTINYYDFISKARNDIKINFVKVKAHTGVELNEKVDKMAKREVGLK